MKKIFPEPKKEWRIGLSDLGKYKLVTLTDHYKINNLFELYLLVLDFVLKDDPLVEVSQFIDEDQGWLNDRQRTLFMIKNIFDLNVAMTKNYLTAMQADDHDKQYVLNIYGKPYYSWFRKIILFGGISLSNIFYGLKNVKENWVEDIAKRNQVFTRWYRMELIDKDIDELRREVSTMCWTSDRHLTFLLEENRTQKVISYIHDLGDEYNLNIILAKDL